MIHMNNAMNIYRVSVIILLFVIGLSAVFTGILLMLEPDGKIIGLSTEILSFSPFSDFFIPGIFLFMLNGIANIVAAVLALIKIQHYPRLITLQGIILLLWIVVQMMFLQEANALQLLMLIVSMVFIVIGEFLEEGKNPFGLCK